MPRKTAPEYVGHPPEAVRAFQTHRARAKQRGIPFLFTFAEWWEWWQTDNRWANKGKRSDAFVMGRKGDVGPYSPENVYCTTYAQNVRDVAPEVKSNASRQAWTKTRAAGDHPVLNRGAGHPRSRAVITPSGRFDSVSLAAEHHGLTHGGVGYKIREGSDGWQYADPD